MKLNNLSEADIFYDEIKDLGTSRYIIIPMKLMEANGWEKGTKLKVWVKKVVQNGTRE